MGYQSHSSTIAIAEESEIVAVIKPVAYVPDLLHGMIKAKATLIFDEN